MGLTVLIVRGAREGTKCKETRVLLTFGDRFPNLVGITKELKFAYKLGTKYLASGGYFIDITGGALNSQVPPGFLSGLFEIPRGR